MVRVGGLVTAVEADAFRLDDGTATATVVLEGPAAGVAPLLQPGDAVNAVGTPDVRGEVVLVVSDPSGVVLLGDPGGDDGDSRSGGFDAMTGAGGVAGTGEATTGALDSAGLVAGRNPGSLAAALAALSLAGAIAAAFAVHRAVTVRRQTQGPDPGSRGCHRGRTRATRRPRSRRMIAAARRDPNGQARTPAARPFGPRPPPVHGHARPERA